MELPDTVICDLKILVRRAKNLMIALGVSRRESIKSLEKSSSRKLHECMIELSSKLDVINPVEDKDIVL